MSWPYLRQCCTASSRGRPGRVLDAESLITRARPLISLDRCRRPLTREPHCLGEGLSLGSGPQAPVAQLDRALPSEGRGHRFESCRVRHSPVAITIFPPRAGASALSEDMESSNENACCGGLGPCGSCRSLDGNSLSRRVGATVGRSFPKRCERYRQIQGKRGVPYQEDDRRQALLLPERSGAHQETRWRRLISNLDRPNREPVLSHITEWRNR
jgi:hypothetical protein